jgi:hypothetical protein
MKTEISKSYDQVNIELQTEVSETIKAGKTYERKFSKAGDHSNMDVNNANIFNLLGWYDISDKASKFVKSENLYSDLVDLIAIEVADEEEAGLKDDDFESGISREQQG